MSPQSTSPQRAKGNLGQNRPDVQNSSSSLSLLHYKIYNRKAMVQLHFFILISTPFTISGSHTTPLLFLHKILTMSCNLEKIWDDTLGGPLPESGFDGEAGAKGMLQKRSSGELEKSRKGIAIARPITKILPRSLSMEGSPPASPAATPRDKENVWRSVFHPGSNMATKRIGAEKFDNVEPRSPTVYDWLYSGETRSNWR